MGQEADKDADAVAEILDHSISVQLDVPEQFPSPEESDEAVSEIVRTRATSLNGYQKFKKFKALLMKKKSQSSLEGIGEETPALVAPDAQKGKKSKGRKKKSLLPKKKKKGAKPKGNTGLKKKGKSTRVSKKRKGSKVLNMA